MRRDAATRRHGDTAESQVTSEYETYKSTAERRASELEVQVGVEVEVEVEVQVEV